MNDDIIRMAREAGLSHFYDSEGDFSGVTDALLVDADKQRNDERLVEILGPLIALVRADEREKLCRRLAALHDELSLASVAKVRMRNVEYERGFIDGMQKQTKSSVDRAVNRMAEQAMLGVWQDVPGAVNFGITDPAAPRCLYPDCVGGKQGTFCHDSCPAPGNPSF